MFRTIFTVVLFLVLLAIAFQSPSLTGAFVEEESYAVNLNHKVVEFFEVSYVLFPRGGCGTIAEQLYYDVTGVPVDSTAGFITSGRDRLATLNFVIDRTSKFGTLDMAKGVVLNGDDSGFISLSSEAIVRVPKDQRSTFSLLDFSGIPAGVFVVTKGSFSTPSVDCTFTSENGNAVCSCKTHPINAIRVAGISSIRPERSMP